jgi:hypothetical protein
LATATIALALLGSANVEAGSPSYLARDTLSLLDAAARTESIGTDRLAAFGPSSEGGRWFAEFVVMKPGLVRVRTGRAKQQRDGRWKILRLEEGATDYSQYKELRGAILPMLDGWSREASAKDEAEAAQPSGLCTDAGPFLITYVGGAHFGGITSITRSSECADGDPAEVAAIQLYDAAARLTKRAE